MIIEITKGMWFAPKANPLSFVLCLLALSCSPPNGEPPVSGTSEDGSEVPSSVQRPATLELLSQSDMTPAGVVAAFRPDVTAIGGELWFVYNSRPEGILLQRLDADLNKVGQPVAAQATTEQTTDARVASADGEFWMAYESVLMPEVDCNQHFLNVASYTKDPVEISQSVQHIATGCPLNREFVENPTGLPANPETTDDPAPFYHHGVRYVLTRAWGTSRIHHLRELNADLSVSEDILLDTSTVVPDRQMSQSALLHIDGKPFLVAGFPSGMWIPPNTSDLYILPLDDELRSFSGPAVQLPVEAMTFPTRITRARHVNGTLIINFIDAFVVAEGLEVSEYLALFDVRDNFTLLSQLQVQDHNVADNHSSFEILDDRLYLFQQQDREKISAKIFRLRP